MKLTNTRSLKSAKGMTLLELTVVILVLLALISILFVGAKAWKKGADKAASVMVIRNTQQAVRSYANLNNFNPGDTWEARPNMAAGETSIRTGVFGEGKFMEVDVLAAGYKHPAGTGYTYVAAAPTVFPALGTTFIATGGSGQNGLAAEFNPGDTAGW